MLPSTKIKLRSFTRLILCLAAAFIIAKVTISATSAASSDGRELYLKYCAACHGADLKGQPNCAIRLTDFLPSIVYRYESTSSKCLAGSGKSENC